MREYERCVTTCANAYVQPLIDRYLGAARARAARRAASRGALRLMHSAGGLVSRRGGARLPDPPAGIRARPAAALATALFGAARRARRTCISFDMGGTTAKACLIEDGRAEIAPMMEAARVHRFKKGTGLPIKAPVIDMIEIGAGGGSIAAIDEVGPAAGRPAFAPAPIPARPATARGGTRADGDRRQPACSAITTPASSSAAA